MSSIIDAFRVYNTYNKNRQEYKDKTLIVTFGGSSGQDPESFTGLWVRTGFGWEPGWVQIGGSPRLHGIPKAR